MSSSEKPALQNPYTDQELTPADTDAESSRPQCADRYSNFAAWQKNSIIGLAAFAGWFSSISSFIYFPAIPFLAVDLGVTIQQVNLTVTSYLIISGVFPSIMGDAADRFGRRPVFLAGLLVYLAANVGLALQSQFAALFALRMLQSAGISGTFSVAYGVLGDLFTAAERGWYSGVLAFFLNTPPSIGPILSGLLLLRWNWRSIFWLLSAFSAFCVLSMATCLPETARNIVGDGTIAAEGINKPLLRVLSPRHPKLETSASCIHRETRPKPAKTANFPNPFAALKLLRSAETTILLLAYGINYSVYSCLQASLSTIFVDTYRISGLAAGLIYIPFGVACAFSAFATGKLLDMDFRKTASKCGIEVEKGKATDLSGFPIEKARLRTVVFCVAVCAALVTAYGWLLERNTHIAAPLALQFVIGLTIQPVFTALNTLLVDIHPATPSTAQAACNFVRCELAAGCLAGLDALLRKTGPGWSFSLFGSSLVLEVAMLVVLQMKGMQWRQSKTTLNRRPFD